jgi:hypothetical protein
MTAHPYTLTVTYENGQEFTSWWSNEAERDAAAADCERRGGFVTCTTREKNQ